MKHDFRLALVTGASSGIGEEICHLLAQKGIPLILCGQDLQRLNEVASSLKKHVATEILPGDLSNPEQLAETIAVIHDKKPDLVINSAGYGMYGDCLTHPTKDILRLLDVNTRAVIEITLESARSLAAQKQTGVIVNISSAVAFQISTGFAIYGASKACINSFSQSMDEEVRHLGIRVLTSCPGLVTTRFSTRAQGSLKSSSLGKKFLVMSPEYVAKQVWKQIEKGKALSIIDWRYKFLLFFTRYLLPTRWVSKALRKEADRRTGQRNILFPNDLNY